MMQAGLVGIIGIILLVLILNTYYAFRRANKRTKRKNSGVNYQPPSEAKRAEWREKEIARRLEREQDDALERIRLRNETLSYYEAVRKMYEKKEAMERLGIKVDDDELKDKKSLTADGNQFIDIRDDITIYEDRNSEGESGHE